jgi:hypothetical protein
MEAISSLFDGRRFAPTKDRRTERGDLMDRMLARLNPARKAAGFKPMKHAALGAALQGIPTCDLYALVSKCDDAERRGWPWSAIFWKELRPSKP